MDPMVGLNLVTLVMASISLALSSLSAVPHIRGLADVIKRWFLRTRDAIAGVMAVVGAVAIVVVGLQLFVQWPQRVFGVSDADDVLAPCLGHEQPSLSDVPGARPNTIESKYRAIEPMPDARE